MRGSAAVILCALVAGTQLACSQAPTTTRRKPLLATIIPEATGKNGYEEYLAAADLVHIRELTILNSATDDSIDKAWDAEAELKRRGMTWSGAWQIFDEADKLGEAYALFKRLQIHSKLDADKKVEELTARSWLLIEQGNRKPILDPRPKVTVETLYPEYYPFKVLARSAPVSARSMLARGDSEAAGRRLAEAYAFSRRASKFDVLGFMVGCAMTNFLNSSLKELSAKLSPKSLEEVETQIHAILVNREPLSDALRKESTMLSVVERVLTKKATSFERDCSWLLLDDSLITLADDSSLTNADRKRLSAEIIHGCAARFQGFIDRLNLPESEWCAPIPRATGLSPQAELVVNALGSFDGEDNYANAFRALAVSRTRSRLARLQIMAAKFTAEQRRNPASLEEFTEKADRKDPINGRTFQFQKTGPKTYRLYSLGNQYIGEIDLSTKKGERINQAAP